LVVNPWKLPDQLSGNFSKILDMEGL
jgi:hypothetical protein